MWHVDVPGSGEVEDTLGVIVADPFEVVFRVDGGLAE